jgi:uncharacterized damage-inducible protein DinB
MAPTDSTLAALYENWEVYQRLLVRAVTALTAEQIGLREAPNLRTIGEITNHILAVRVRWFNQVAGAPTTDPALMTDLATWDREGQPSRTGPQLVKGLEASWQLVKDALAHWTAADLDPEFTVIDDGESYTFTRKWIVWHVLEHDLHHGGELSLTLGAHGFTGIDI